MGLIRKSKVGQGFSLTGSGEHMTISLEHIWGDACDLRIISGQGSHLIKALKPGQSASLRLAGCTISIRHKFRESGKVASLECDAPEHIRIEPLT